MTNKEKENVKARTGYTKADASGNIFLYYVNIEEYKDGIVWNVITVIETESKLVAKNRMQDLALMFNCEWRILYE